MKNTIIENFDNFDSSYRDIYSYVMNETDNLNLETGVIEFEDMADAYMAQSILKDAYPNVEISTSDDEDKPGYVVFFSYSVEEDLDKFLANKNPEGTPVANPSFGESLEEDMNLLERYYSDFDDYLDDSNTEPEDDALWNDEEFDDFHDSEDYPVGRKDVYPWTWVKVDGEFVRMGDDGHIYSSKEAEQIYNKKHSGTKESLDKFEESVEKHDTLNQKIFNGDELDPVVKDKLLEIVDNFKSALEQDGINLDIKDVRIIGSNASYNYTAQSDIDLHIFADLSVYPDQEELVEKIYNAYKTLWNNKYDPTIYGHEVEIYVEPYDGE